MTNPFGQLPSGAAKTIEPFEAHVADDQLEDFKTLLRLSKLAPVTYEGLQEDRRYGVTNKWMAETKEYWQNKYDWRAAEKKINSFANFKATVEDDDGEKHQIHFAALFSKNPEAVPVIATQGWPGSFLEYLPMMDILRTRHKPEDLPFHFIAPSMTGYGYSSPPPLRKNWTVLETTKLLHKVMLSLGFTSYLAQGGDVGSGVSRILAVMFSDNCKGAHLNLCMTGRPQDPVSESADETADREGLDDLYRQGLKRRENFSQTGFACAMEHGTRSSTIGHVVASNPIAALAWIGEKFLEWSDKDPALDDILDDVTLWYLNETHPNACYPYRGMWETKAFPQLYISSALGFSWFPKEIASIPESWIAKTGNLVFFKRHNQGGHFAALEQPEELLQDFMEFTKIVKEKGAKL